MEPQNDNYYGDLDYYEDLYYYEDYYLEDYGEHSSPHSEEGAAGSSFGIACDDPQSQGDSENQQAKLNNDQVPENDLDPEGAQREQEHVETDHEEPAIPLPAVPKRKARRHQIPFSFTLWQVQEMETMFQETQYPDVLTRYVDGTRAPGASAQFELTFPAPGSCRSQSFPSHR